LASQDPLRVRIIQSHAKSDHVTDQHPVRPNCLANWRQMRILVAGAGGFIGGHLTKQLIAQGNEVTAVDNKPFENWYQFFEESSNHVADLKLIANAHLFSEGANQIYNLAADMGGMGFIEKNKAKCMESVLINTHLLQAARDHNIEKFFFSSSACVYASFHQNSLDISPLKESDAYPADPEDGYGWEKLFSERMCKHFFEDYGLQTRVARYHNVYGPHGTYLGGREKVPAAACRKIIEAVKSKTFDINIWGDGKQLRSFTYITDCIDGTLKLMNSQYADPLNIGSSEMISINDLYRIIIEVMGMKYEQFKFSHDLNAPQGVRGRSSENSECRKILSWEPNIQFKVGIKDTFDWIAQELNY
jgi:GDP-D-mannose 3',5'-epimerase